MCKNPRNPGFNHYLFESVAALIRHAGASNPGMIDTFEQLLFPAFNHVLQQVSACGWSHTHRGLAEGSGLSWASSRSARGIAMAEQAITGAALLPWLGAVGSVAAQDVQEFHPYVFQIFAQLIELRPAPLPAVYLQVCGRTRAGVPAGGRARARAGCEVRRPGPGGVRRCHRGGPHVAYLQPRLAVERQGLTPAPAPPHPCLSRLATLAS